MTELSLPPAISLLIANYNNSRYLAECIQSVFTQSWSNWEIVIVDDHSTDGFADFIAAFIKDSRIRIFYNDCNKGCSFTKNRLASLGVGNLMAFLDPDDALMPHALEKMILAHEQNLNCSLVHSSHMLCDEHLVPVRRAEYPRALPPGVPYLLLSDGSVHAFASFKRANYLSTAGLNPDRYFDKAIDQELYYLLEETGPFVYIDYPLYFYRIHSGSISNMGNEYDATNVHYEIVLDRCRKRLENLKNRPSKPEKQWISTYKTRFHRVRILLSLRKGQYLNLFSSLIQYPFVGGGPHLLGYMRRFLSQGSSLTKKSASNYSIVVRKPEIKS